MGIRGRNRCLSIHLLSKGQKCRVHKFGMINIESVLQISNSVSRTIYFIFFYKNRAQSLRDVTWQNNKLQRKDTFSANGCHQNSLLKITFWKKQAHILLIYRPHLLFINISWSRVTQLILGPLFSLYFLTGSNIFVFIQIHINQ